MGWLLCAWLAGVVPSWAYVYTGLRPHSSRARAWAVASGCSLAWPAWLWLYRRWHRRDAERRARERRQLAEDLAAVAAIESELFGR